MITLPWNAASKKMINMYLTRNDIHDWTVGYELGRDGYRHIHIRLNARDTFTDLQRFFTGCHIEEATSDDDWYEHKDGHFVSSKDTVDVRRCRFGRLRDNQLRILNKLDEQNDRGVLVWVDFKGGIGKSYFCRWLTERNQAYYVPPTVNDSKQIIQYVCSGYKGQRYIVIDIPRSAKWTESLYCGIESIKDGLVYDTRYSAKIRDIWGVKILVLTNGLPRLDALSKDRWTFCNRQGYEVAQGMINITLKKLQPKPTKDPETEYIICHKKNGGTYKRRKKIKKSEE
ncbi:replication associated protein [Panthera leo smacovirus 1]|uniref:Replication associated protein n=1 Tax=Panthera leo smacovirus 1 TaxID=2592416 RepID=A0A513ZT32_9VIRU|nr:replication associated protein [Panthera leo smacovirus 1]QDH43742.1 replication associated protein [Panthera leo smacovirus 1]